MSTNYIIYAYGFYVVASILLTVWVARTLHRNGRVFLIDAFGGNADLADSVNHLLVVGFYLINIGYVALMLKEYQTPETLRQTVEFVSTKMGLVLLILGAMHFFNLFVFSRLRRHGLTQSERSLSVPPPINQAVEALRTAAVQTTAGAQVKP